MKSRRQASKPLRVLMVVDQFNIGGTETHLFVLIRELLRLGVEVGAAGKNGRMLERFIGLGIPCYEIDFVLDNYELDAAGSADHQAVLESIIREGRYDVVHAHQFPSGYIAFEAAERAKVPFVFTLHGQYYEEMFLQRIKERSEMITVSPPLWQMLSSKGISSFLIVNGIETEDYDAYRSNHSLYRRYIRHKLNLPDNAKVFVYASRLSWEKAELCQEIIHCISALRVRDMADAHLIIAGGGKKEQSVQQLVSSHNELFGFPFIHYVGEVSNIHTYYAASDAVIGTGRIALEAMACGRPVLAAGSVGYCGLIHPPSYALALRTWFGDHDAEFRITRKGLIRDMREVSLLTEDRLQEIAATNLQYIRKHFPISRIGKETVKVYERALRLSSKTLRKGVKANGNR